jgi:polyhydroxybutyrate depolymerase
MLYKVNNGGHTWPGSIGVTGAGNTNRDISASDEIWKFVSRFSLNLPTAVHDAVPVKVSCHPNPTVNGSVTLRFSHLNSQSRLTVSNTQGITIYTALIPAQTTELRVNLPNANPGIHILKLQDEKECYVSKIITQ